MYSNRFVDCGRLEQPTLHESRCPHCGEKAVTLADPEAGTQGCAVVWCSRGHVVIVTADATRLVHSF